jgi:hypothetical protein
MNLLEKLLEFLRRLFHVKVKSFIIKGESMALQVVQGGKGTFTATPQPAGTTVPTGTIPQWTSSDVTTATVASPNPDPTGLTTVLTGIKIGTITLTITVTLPDNSVASGSITVPILAGEVKSFNIAQTA